MWRWRPQRSNCVCDYVCVFVSPLPEEGNMDSSCALGEERTCKCTYRMCAWSIKKVNMKHSDLLTPSWILSPSIFLCTFFDPAPPNSLHISGGLGHRKRRTLVAPDMNLSLDQSEGSLLSDDFLDTPDDLDINVDDIETPDETDSLEFPANGNDLEWEGKWCSLFLLKLVPGINKLMNK